MRVRFVAHDASRTGAPLALLTFLRWAHESSDVVVDADLVLDRGGPLVEDFSALLPTTVLHGSLGERDMLDRIELGLGEIGWRGAARAARRLHARARVSRRPLDLVYLNGVGASGAASVLVPSAAPTLLHVHELADGASRARHPDAARFELQPDRFVAVSPGVQAMVVERWGVAEDRIDLVPAYLPIHPIRAESIATEPTPPALDEPLVAAMGSGGRRKGVDLFLQLGAQIHAVRPEIHFAWIGPLDDPEAVSADATAAGLGEVLHLPGELVDAAPWLEAADLFVSVAREDPFPLAVLEAMAAGVSVLAFATGGAADLLVAHGHEDAVIAPLDVAALAVRSMEALDAPLDQAELQAEVRARHRIEVAGPALLDAMQATVAGAG